MRNKGFIIVLTTIITLLCLYYLSFTIVSRQVQNKAVKYATEEGSVNLLKKQRYLDSVWNKPVYNLFGTEYTYKEVKESELSLGLDLQGGMHVVLEISPADIIRGLSGNHQDPALNDALKKARTMQQNSAESFTTLFIRAFKQAHPDIKLATYFATSANKERLKISDSDDDVKAFLDKETDDAIDRSYIILKTRIDQFGTSQPNIQRLPGTGRIQIEIPGADNPQRVRKLLQGVARLEFWQVVEYNDPKLSQALMAINELLSKEKRSPSLKKELEKGTKESEKADTDKTKNLADTTKNLLEKQLKAAAKDTSKKALDSARRASTSILFSFSGGRPFLYDVKDTAAINAVFRRPDVRTLMPGTIEVLWDVKGEPELTPGIDDIQLNFINKGRTGKPLLTGEVINDARLDYDQFARPSVSMTMNAAGAKAWAKITAAEAAKSPQGRIAIVLDKYVYTAPTVQGEIPNGNSQITGSFTLEEAKDMANVLKAGSLPAPTRIVEEAIVGPSLGKVAQNQGLISMAVGLILVVLFMIIYYSKGGFVADLALLFNIFFILGILAQFNAALTLPGIAGIVLTMGMAVDANVLIYERIKEELQHGKRLREAVKIGYQKAFGTIFDSNLTTLLTGIALFIFGQGPLKGFAIVLIVGLITSFFSSIYISHVIIEWLIRKGEDAHVSFDSFISRMIRKRPQIDFIKHRRKVYVVAIAFLVLGFAMIAWKGLNMGVDFKGGRSYTVVFNQPVVATDMKVALSNSFQNSSTEVKNYGSDQVMKVTTSYMVEDESEEADETVKSALVKAISEFSKREYTTNEVVDNTHFTISGSSKVGATIADDIKGSAMKASLISLVAIFLYILFRFKSWTFSTGAIAATIHDTFFVVAAFGVVHVMGISFEIDQVFVASLLTIIGYSLNDTVIVFDRIREYLSFGTNHDKATVFNDAINSTLSRTLITSITVLMVTVVLLIFGGEVLRGFSFALTLGILVGTFSSIYIASAVVLDLENWKAKRKKSPTKVLQKD